MTNKNKWLIGAGGLLAIAASLFFFLKKKDHVHEKPPKAAPQLDIENPGTQDDFTASPSDSEVG